MFKNFSLVFGLLMIPCLVFQKNTFDERLHRTQLSFIDTQIQAT